MSQKNITVGIINDNRILLLKRGETAPWQPNKYCFPGGGVESGESLVTAAIRETLEETSLSLVREDLHRLVVRYKNGNKKIVYVARISDPIVTLNYEHSESVWLTYKECSIYYHNKLLVPYLISKLSHLHKKGYF